MTVSFRVGRYLVALLWHAFPYLLIGFAVGSIFSTLQVVKVMESVDDYFYQAMTKVVHQCAPSDPANAADSDPVKGRAPGLSEHAPPFGQTEARAERTLERPPP
ncbi:hypothetical protein SAMN03159511_1127 [Pseudomonas sp. NFACC19-2]|uniref:hypothetical protein n=1 Tax=Ectopseudomonas guguanensis TaxID=1198456 RepID=UPI00090886D4|nr:hypothetical protein [Pseudomonas sp. NFACC19-2]SFW17876.1 hypothetical protein SAMN03159511_1127 [Pseudomonas sp. NFACC19-2]